jgi:FdhD protein
VERPLTIYLDRREIVTLMTLGQQPELLVLGYLLNQRLIGGLHEVAAVNVDWDVDAAAVSLHPAWADAAQARQPTRFTIVSGCGQGTMFGDLESSLIPVPSAARVPLSVLQDIGAAMRALPSIHRDAGSVNGTALWALQSDRAGSTRMLHAVEDVGRHNAVDTVAGWMAMQGLSGDGKLLFTTGRLTSEMVVKAVQLRVGVVVSRNGVTAMGADLASRLGITLCGRASGQRLLCYAGAQRIDWSAGA